MRGRLGPQRRDARRAHGLAAERPVAYTTVMTLMRLLEAKGDLDAARGNDRA